MKAAICLLALVLPTLALGAEELPPTPDLGRAFATIPYSELRALWEAGRKKEPPKVEPELPPVAFVVHQAEYRLQLSDEASLLDADYEIESLDNHWQTIPLLGGEARLDKAEAGDRSIVSQDGYALLSNQPGKIKAALHLVATGAKRMTNPGVLKLRFGCATVKRLIISGIPANLEMRVNGTRAAETKDGTAIYYLPAESGEVNVQLATPRVEDAPKPLQPSHWQVQSQAVVRYAEGRLLFQSHLSARADNGSGTELLLLLPSNAGAVAVSGEDVAESTAGRADDGQRTLRVVWKTPDILDRELTVVYALPQSPLAEQWSLPAPVTPGQAEARNLFAIVTAGGLELKGAGVQAAVPSARLPQWMQTEIAGDAFTTVEAGALLTLQTHWLPTVATAEAIVSDAKCELRLVVDGSMQTSATYVIRHVTPLAWTVELPKEVELLTCTVDGKSERPVLRENGALELSLPIPHDAKGVTEVAFVYAAKTTALDPVSGQLALETPRTPLFIERLEWLVSIPGNYEVTAIDGNVAATGGARSERDVQTIALRKDFCRGERPAVALFYQRRGLDH